MYKQYLKQAWQLMKQNRFYSAVYIIGTGLAISLVMVMAIVYYIRTADIAPEVNRSRMLINLDGNSKSRKEGGNSSYQSSLSYKTIKECFYSLETPECVSAQAGPDWLKFVIGDIYVTIPGSDDVLQSYMKCTDANFWKMFELSFIKGKPYTEEEFQSGFKKLVLSESLAQKLFASTDVVGNAVVVNDVEYIIGGVVKDVSATMGFAFADLWVPFTSVPIIRDAEFAEGVCGHLCVYILAKKTSDFDAIKEELEQKRIQYNSTLIEHDFLLRDGFPYTQTELVLRSLDYRTTPARVALRFLLFAIVFLLVPAVNLSGLTSSRMQERVSELGIRKAFGANRSTLVNQVLVENLVLTVLGGVVGLIVSYLIVISFSNLLIGKGTFFVVSTDITLSPGMLINYTVFLYAFGICVVLNLLSSIVPVWNSSKKAIVESLNDK